MSRAAVLWRPPDIAPPPSGDAWQFWSADRIADVTQCPQAAVEANWPAIHAALTRRGGASRESQAGALGTIAIETASTFMPVREAYWLPETWRAANLRYHPWYGRGYIQLTWESNYQDASRAIGIDLLVDPDRAMLPPVAAEVFVWYWCEARPTIPAHCDAHNWAEVRRLVQGGSDGLDRLTRIAETLLRLGG